MIRQPEHEQLNRLNVKATRPGVHHVCQRGVGLFLFEAQAVTDLVKEVYFPWLSQPEAIQAGLLVMTAVSANEPGHKVLSKCQMVPVVLTLHAGEEDHQYHLAHRLKGTVALCRRQNERLA
jgi:hypothetical protein